MSYGQCDHSINVGDFADERIVVEHVDREPPHKIDENMWKNREHMEEIVYLLDRSHWPSRVMLNFHWSDFCDFPRNSDIPSWLLNTSTWLWTKRLENG